MSFEERPQPRATEIALRHSQERYHAVVAALEEGIVIHEADGSITSCNASACRILGLPESRLLGRTARNPAWRAIREDGSRFEPESHPATITLLTGQPCSRVIMGVERKDGSRTWISLNSRPLRRDGEEDPYAVAVSFTDITHLKETERELRRRADQQAVLADLGRHALKGTDLSVLLKEAVARVAAVLEVELCKVCERVPGTSRLRLRAGRGWVAGRAGEPQLAGAAPGASPESSPPARLAGITVPIPGRSRPWGILGAHTRGDRPPERPLRPEEAQFLQSVANVLAIATERHQVEERQEQLQRGLLVSAQEWRLTFDAITHPLLLVELDGRIVRMNRAARALSGVDFEDAIQQPISTLGDAQPWRAIAGRLPEVEATAAAATVQARDDLGRTWDVTMSPVTSPDNQRGVVVVARDITDLVRLQESLRRSETMSAMGALVAGVAHEVRNPLFGISATLDALEARFKRRPDFRRYFEILQGEVRRLSELMRQLLDYGKPLRLERSPLAPREVLQAAAAACEPLAGRAGVTLLLEAAPDLPLLEVDPLRITQVFQNLLENAVQHSAEGGRVRFRAEGRPDGILFFVEDAGPGFAPADLPHVFEPFFTRRRGGTGLGLSIVQRIVEQHGGEIAAGNREAGGAVMSVRLPLGRKSSDSGVDLSSLSYTGQTDSHFSEQLTEPETGR